MSIIKELVFFYLLKYGYIVLFFSFTFELLAVPLPGELIMGYVGFLSYQGKMDWLLSILSVSLGLCMGISIAYFIGHKFGHPLFQKYGHYIHMGPAQMDALSVWFTRYGNKVLIAGYFIPGIRHFTGYFAGIIEIPVRVFMLYAYLGAFIFASTFISLGRFLGPDWEKYHPLVEKYLAIAVVIAVLIFILVYLLRTNNLHIDDLVSRLLGRMVERYHYSLLRVKILASAVLLIFSTVVILMVGIIQNFLARDLGEFDTTLYFLSNLLIKRNSVLLQYANYLTSIDLIGVAMLFGALWIFFRSKERGLDICFLLIVLIGGQAVQNILRLSFHQFAPITSASASFPSEQAFLVLVSLGYILFLYLRYSDAMHIGVRSLVSMFFVLVLVMVGFNHIILAWESPSDVLAGYVFGTVWLFFNLILLEIIRLQINRPWELNPNK